MNSTLTPPSLAPFDVDGLPNRAWTEWTVGIFRAAKKFRGSGTTANRPLDSLETGDWYFDTTLNKPIWYAGTVWRDAAGFLA